jgi:hypothetical protein
MTPNFGIFCLADTLSKLLNMNSHRSHALSNGQHCSLNSKPIENGYSYKVKIDGQSTFGFKIGLVVFFF